MKRALIVASGLRSVLGHNFFYTQVVERELKNRGFEVTVFANKHAPKEFIKMTGYEPIFSIGTYDFVPFNGPMPDLIYSYLQSGIYAYELHAALKNFNGEKFDLVFCHTVSDFELIAWNRYLKKKKLKAHLFVMQRNTPKFSSTSKWKLLIHPYWRIKPHYLNALYRKMKDRFVLLTDSQLLSEDYKRIFSHKIITAPIPIEGFVPQAKETDPADQGILRRYNLPNNEFISFGFMGDSRHGKGFSLIPPMIEKVLKTEKKVRFVLQCQTNEYDTKENSPGLSELEALADIYPDNVILVAEKLSDKDYLTLFNYIDIMMIPYTDSNFIEGTSNIFTEAVALGKPVIVSDNTWMSKELDAYKGGAKFKKGDIDDFAAKTVELTKNYGLFAKKAMEYSPVWRGNHNVKNLVDILLEEANL